MGETNDLLPWRTEINTHHQKCFLGWLQLALMSNWLSLHPVLWCVLQNLGNLKVIKPWWVGVKKWTGDQLWNILLHIEFYFYFSFWKKYTLKHYFSCQIKRKWQVQVQTHLVVLTNNIIENKVSKWVFKYHSKKFFRDMLFPNSGFYG